jgi:8-oxo-dGTP pyrophosphatase MutT (NUDIX family)
MGIKINFNDKTIFLVQQNDISLESIAAQKNVSFITTKTKDDILKTMESIKSSSSTDICIIHEDVDFLIECFFSPFHIIEAAGGLVINKDKEMLFIYRRGKWDLPKGKMEAGETPEICAEREIEEETGVNHLQLIHKIIDTYHIYEERGQQILKKTYWFYFTTNFEGTPKPQIEEDISSISWIAKENLAMPLSNTYDSIMDVIEKGAPIF